MFLPMRPAAHPPHASPAPPGRQHARVALAMARAAPAVCCSSLPAANYGSGFEPRSRSTVGDRGSTVTRAYPVAVDPRFLASKNGTRGRGRHLASPSASSHSQTSSQLLNHAPSPRFHQRRGSWFIVRAEAEATFDIKLPRRSLLVQFTCTKCNERTKRLINRVAYERGTVFLQCAGCQVYHKFVDNLGLVVEYDLREENGADTCTED